MPAPETLPAPRTSGSQADGADVTPASVALAEPTEREDTAAVGAGLDALEAQAPQRTPWWIRARRSVLPPLVAVAVLIGIWQLVFLSGVKRPDILPSPAMVWQAFVDLFADGKIFDVVWTSLHRGVIGFALSIVLGTALGLAIARVRWLRAAIGPLLTGLQSLPSIAWVPAAVIWFGLSDAAIYSVVLLGAVPSIANGLVSGVDHVPPQFLRVGRVLGMGAWGQIRHVLLPAALPGYLAGLRQGWAFAWRSSDGRGTDRHLHQTRLRPRPTAQPGPRPVRHAHRARRHHPDLPRRGRHRGIGVPPRRAVPPAFPRARPGERLTRVRPGGGHARSAASVDRFGTRQSPPADGRRHPGIARGGERHCGPD